MSIRGITSVPQGFKDIPGYEGRYAADRNGNVWTYTRRHLLKHTIDRQGYAHVELRDKPFLVHRIVLMTFRGASPLEVNHKNGIKLDNRLDNLEYCTRSQNMKHAYKTGLKTNRGNKSPVRKLNEDQVKVIKYHDSRGPTAIAADYGVKKSCISAIKTGRAWSHV